MSEHTPTPWRNIHGRIISDVMPRDGSHDICRMTVINNNHFSAEANAELIVKAVNNHDAMVKALEGQVSAAAPAIKNLASHQEQCDMEGVMVKVSRQALDEVLRAIEAINSLLGVAP